MATQKAVVLKLEKVAIPERLIVKATITKGERVGIALPGERQRKTLARKILGYDADCSGVVFADGSIKHFSEVSRANVRARTGVNLTVKELGEGSAPAEKAAKKIEKAHTLLEGFETYTAFVMHGIKDYAGSPIYSEARERFLRWLANLGLRHATPAQKVAPAQWGNFWLAAALAFGSRLLILVDPLEGLDLMATRRTMDALRAFVDQNKETSILVLAESSAPPLGALCERWVEKKG